VFEYNGKEYELKYNLKRVELIENTVGMPMMADIASHKGMLGLTALKAYFAYGLKEEGSDIYVAPKNGLKIAEDLIESTGYITINGAVMDAMQRDCPFFFQGA
jgi:hypothetical protein